MPSPILKYFKFTHLPEHLQKVSKPFGELAEKIDTETPDGPEKSAGLGKLLEAKDCIVRAVLPLLMLAILTLTGCLSISRAEYERVNAEHQKQIAEFRLENGDTRVCYGGLNPQINPITGTYTCPSGMRVVTYRGTIDGGKMVARWWQDDERLMP